MIVTEAVASYLAKLRPPPDPPGGQIVSFEIDAERHAAAREYLARAGVLERADLRLADAREGLRRCEATFDMAFIDGVKAQYGEYLDALLPRLWVGAVVAADNALMSGAVAAGRGEGHWSDEQIASARALGDRVLSHPQLTGTLTPLGDGVLVAVKR